jgi:hypothetical protein
MKILESRNADFSPHFGKLQTEVCAPLMMKFKTTLIAILFFLLSSCAGKADGSISTPVVAEAADQSQVAFDAAQTPSPVPFQFNLPTPGAEPISGWRPPLYPVPWAMSPYDHFYFSRPIAADNVNWPLAQYRYGGVFFAPNIVHTGVDIDAEMGALVPVRSSQLIGDSIPKRRVMNLIRTDRLWWFGMILVITVRHFIRSMPT